MELENSVLETIVISDDDSIPIYDQDNSFDEDFQPYEFFPFIEKIQIDHLADLVNLCQDESNIKI